MSAINTSLTTIEIFRPQFSQEVRSAISAENEIINEWQRALRAIVRSDQEEIDDLEFNSVLGQYLEGLKGRVFQTGEEYQKKMNPHRENIKALEAAEIQRLVVSALNSVAEINKMPPGLLPIITGYFVEVS